MSQKITTLKEIAAKTGPCLSFEFFPPKTAENLATTKQLIAELAQYHPDFMSVTYGAVGGTRDLTFALVDYINAELQQTAVAHFTCVGHSRHEIETLLARYERAGIVNLLALRGDPPVGQVEFQKHPGGFDCARDLVRFISSLGKFNVAVAGYPEKHKEAVSCDADLHYLREKVDAGADVVITQMFFDSALYFRFLERAQSFGISVPILPGIIPIYNLEQIKRFSTMCGASIPGHLTRRLALVENDETGVQNLGISYAVEMIEELLSGGAPGVHLFTLNRPHQIKSIIQSVQTKGYFL